MSEIRAKVPNTSAQNHALSLNYIKGRVHMLLPSIAIPMVPQLIPKYSTKGAYQMVSPNPKDIGQLIMRNK